MATISSHTLNAVDGTHAGGIEVTLVNRHSGETLFTTTTDSAGRLSEEIDTAANSSTDQYELIFKTSAYWAKCGITHTQLVEEIVLRFVMPEGDARYHMPVILSPNGYSMWSSEPE